MDLMKEEQRMKCSGWCQARVKAVKEDVLFFTYLHELEDYDVTEDRWSLNIAKHGSKTAEDWAWKAELKEGRRLRLLRQGNLDSQHHSGAQARREA